MNELFGVYCTDGTAKNNTKFTISALEDLIWQGSEGRPLNISHDFHRFIGWNIINGLYISHELSYVVGESFLPDSENERKTLQALRKSFYYDFQEEWIKEYKNDFLTILRNRALVNDRAKWLYNGIALYGYEGILFQAFPYIKNLLDGDSMIKIESLQQEFDYKGQGVFEHIKSKLAIILHPFFRRSFSRINNYNFNFLELLWKVYQDGNKSVKVLLDPDFIGYAPSFKPSHEFEYWYGPKYNDDIESIPPGLCHLENNETDYWHNKVKFTEFIWQKKIMASNTSLKWKKLLMVFFQHCQKTHMDVVIFMPCIISKLRILTILMALFVVMTQNR